MISLAYINVLSIIDDDIVINETVYNDVYKYVDKIVKAYSILPLIATTLHERSELDTT